MTFLGGAPLGCFRDAGVAREMWNRSFTNRPKIKPGSNGSQGGEGLLLLPGGDWHQPSGADDMSFQFLSQPESRLLFVI